MQVGYQFGAATRSGGWRDLMKRGDSQQEAETGEGAERDRLTDGAMRLLRVNRRRRRPNTHIGGDQIDRCVCSAESIKEEEEESGAGEIEILHRRRNELNRRLLGGEEMHVEGDETEEADRSDRQSIPGVRRILCCFLSEV